MKRTKYTDAGIRKKMLQSLVPLQNRKQSRFIKRILHKIISIPEAKTMSGLFMQVVLKGDFSTAMARATAEEFYLLGTIPYKVEKKNWGLKYVINY